MGDTESKREIVLLLIQRGRDGGVGLRLAVRCRLQSTTFRTWMPCEASAVFCRVVAFFYSLTFTTTELALFRLNLGFMRLDRAVKIATGLMTLRFFFCAG